MSVTKNNKGFTLIELVIVLAIGALVIAGVILAIGGAQQNRRDSARRDDLGKIVSKLENFASNNRGCYPGMTAAQGCTGVGAFVGAAGTDTFQGRYLFDAGGNPTYRDPSTSAAYTYAAGTEATITANLATNATAQVVYELGQDCANNAAARAYSIYIQLENGRQTCRDNR